jgi:sugar O-acyltransferase (sialic acid O-acetyltransferase NeuD family)
MKSRPKSRPAAGAARDVVILGVGGNCIDILDTINEVNRAGARPALRCIGFLDDDPAQWGKRIHGVKVLGPLASAADWGDARFVNGIGSPHNHWKRSAIVRSTGIPDHRFLTVVHPTASVSAMARLGHGCVLLQHVTVASNAVLGNHVIVLPNSVISHDDVIGDHVAIAGGVCVSGNVRIGRASYLGTNSCIIGNVSIGERCLIGMGSVVLRDVADGLVVAGNPARKLRHSGGKMLATRRGRRP